MKRKGFTLIELLAVIVILAIIALIATPIILGVIEDSKKKAFENTAYGLIESAKQTIARTQLTDPSVSEASYLFKDGVVTGSPTLEFTGEVPQNGALKIYDNGNSSIAISNGKYCVRKTYFQEKLIMEDYIAGECNLEYTEAVLNGADPVLSNGMIPIYFDGTVAKKADVSKAWYNYTNKEWANIVLVTEATREKYQNMKHGGIITESDVLAYLVWVPRYKYAIPAGSNARKINVVFENKNTAKSTGNAIDTNYLTHPGFTFGNEELSGIWVGKFETTGTAANPTVLPNTQSLTTQTLSSSFNTSKLFSTGYYGLSESNDSHMMKNSEWGAVSYLVNSQYGRYNSDGSCIASGCEIWINNVNTGTGTTTGLQWGPSITGCAGSSVSAAVTNDMTTCTSGYDYKTKGVNASATGNITGLYDMSGGVWEIVMGNLDKTVALSGVNFTNINEKYYDLYKTTTITTACNGGVCYGHGLSETVGWNSDASVFVSTTSPWFGRGGHYRDGAGSGAGIFDFGRATGGAGTFFGSRVVVLGK